MRQCFITSVKQMGPIDALVLKAVRDSTGTWKQPARDAIARNLTCSTDEVMVSIDHLTKLACISGNFEQLHMRPFGTLLMKVESD